MRVLVLSEEKIRCVAPTLPEVVALVEQAYRLDAQGKAQVPTKIGVHPPARNSLLHAMPAFLGDLGALGMKWVSYFPGNLARGLPDSSAIIILNDPEHGLPCCIMEGMYVTFLRTAACAAVAVKYLAARAPQSLGLIGCGGVGRWTLRVMSAVFPSIERVLVSSRTRKSREAFCAQMREEGSWTIAAVDDPLEAVRDIDIVVTSIPPGEARPVTGAALRPGTTFVPLDVVNSWQDSVLQSVERLMADNPANFCARVQARGADASAALKMPEPIQELVIGCLPRAAPADRNLVAVCGIATTDVVVASEIHRRARAAKVGIELDLSG
jgi:alanine dehydrogenase